MQQSLWLQTLWQQSPQKRHRSPTDNLSEPEISIFLSFKEFLRTGAQLFTPHPPKQGGACGSATLPWDWCYLQSADPQSRDSRTGLSPPPDVETVQTPAAAAGIVGLRLWGPLRTTDNNGAISN
ncbi:unnamed protein product [Arctogadus glacialis]